MKTKLIISLLVAILSFSLISCQDDIELKVENPYIEVKSFKRITHIRYAGDSPITVLDTIIDCGHFITNDFVSLEYAKSRYVNKGKHRVETQYYYLNESPINYSGQSYAEYWYIVTLRDKAYYDNFYDSIAKSNRANIQPIKMH